MARDGSSAADARARIAAQMPLAQKAALADALLENSGGRRQLAAQVGDLAARLRAGALLPGLLLSPYGLALGAGAAARWGPALLARVASVLR